jgi:hypothetical protein
LISVSPASSTTVEKLRFIQNIPKVVSIRTVIELCYVWVSAWQELPVLWDSTDVCFCCRRDKRTPQRQAGSLLHISHACYSALTSSSAGTQDTPYAHNSGGSFSSSSLYRSLDSIVGRQSVCDGILMWTALKGLGLRTAQGKKTHVNEPSGSIKHGNFWKMGSS